MDHAVNRRPNEQDDVEAAPHAAGRVPVIPWTSVDARHRNAKTGPFRRSDDWVYTTKPIGQGAFALRIHGESMERLEAGPTAIVIDPLGRPVSGSLVVARCGPGEAISVKRLIRREGRSYLEPLDPRFPRIEVTSGTQIYGVVRQKVVDCDL